MERRLQTAVRSGQSNVARQLQAEIVRVREDVAAVSDPRTPAAPIEMTHQTAVYAAPDGRPYSEVVIDFADVTVATDATAIQIDAYELWGREETTWNGTGTPPPWIRSDVSSTSSFLSGPYSPGSKWRFRIRALGKNMVKPGNWSAEFVVNMAADTTAPPVPPNPDISQRLGVIYLKWNGKASSGNPMPLDFWKLEVAEGPASTPTTIIDQTLLGAGEILLGGRPYDETRYYRWRAVDWSGNKSAWSGDVSIVVQPLVTGDISGLDTTIQEQTERAESAEAAALQAAADAQTAQANAATSATNAANSQTAAQAAAADAAQVQQAADAVQADADAAAASAAAAAADAQAAADAAAASQTAAQEAEAALQAQLGEGGVIIRGDTEPTVEQRLPNNVWLKSDGSMWIWDETVQAWTPQTNQDLIDLGLQVDAAEDAAVAAEASAATSASNAAASASTATAAQTAATNAQNAAAASASTANEAQAEAEAAAQAAQASQTAAAQAAADADAAAVAAGSSSAAALAAEEAAEAANLAADAARDEVNAYILAGDTIIVNGNFDAPITNPPLGWPLRTLTYNEASTGIARSGSQVLRATPTTATIAYAYTDWIAGQTDRTYYVEYYIRLREALKAGNSAQQLGAYYSWTQENGTTGSTSVYQNNGAPAVSLSALSTTTWVRVATTYKVTTANVKLVRFGPRIPAVTTTGQNFEIDDFRVVDITHAQAALDAAAAAQSTANTANSAAGTAQQTANNALAAANGIADNYFSTDPPSGTAVEGSVWFQVNGTGQVIGQWQQTASPSGGTWTKRDIRSETIANLDVGKLSGGFINSIHIETETLRVGTNSTLADTINKASSAEATVTGWKHPSDVTFIDGGKLYTDSVKALQIDTNNLAADTAFVGQMKTGILTADAITTTMLAATAITSKHTITGALFQTTTTASRGVKFDSTGINAWDPTGISTFQVDAATGFARISGRYYSGAPGTGGVGIIPAIDSYNLKQVAILFSPNGSYGSTNAGMWVDDTAGAQVLNLRGHNGGDVEIKSQNLQMNIASGRIGNFSNWALGDATNGNNYLPNLSINPPSGTGWFRITNAPTVSASANVVIATTPAGVLYKSTSSLRYKAAVQDWTPDYAILGIQPRSWVDRNPADKADPMKRYYGAIAEEVFAVLPELVTLNEFDEPDAIQYDRLAVALIPVLRDIVTRVEVLEGA
jgi:hypothetical protein